VLQIIVILLVAEILIPLIAGSINERVKIWLVPVVYAVTFVWVVYTLFTGKVGM
jgi:hypothetical protein